MRVLHVVPSYYPAVRYGGPIVSVRGLCEALARTGVEVDVATTDADGPRDLDVPTDRWTELGGVRVQYFHRWPRVDFAVSVPLTRFLVAEARRYDLIHVAGTFSFPSLVAARVAHANRVPYVISPHGSLEPWALSKKRWKKVPYWRIFERRNLERAAAIHATSDVEARSVRALFPGAKIFISPNGVEVVPPPAEERSQRQVVFLGRIHRIKGLDVLVRAMSLVTRELPDAETLIAGPDDEGEWPRIEAIVATLSPRPRVRYLGPVNGDERWRLLASSAVFALPSHSENFGVAVLEALACGTPAVVSQGCPWAVLEERGAGRWVPNEPEQFAGAILELLRSPERRAAMSRAATELAAGYAWPRLGEEMAAFYADLVRSRRVGEVASGA